MLIEEENQERLSNGTLSVVETKETEQEGPEDDDDFQRQINVNNDPIKKVSYAKLLKMPRVTFAMLAGAFGNFVFCVLEPTLALRLQDYNATTI